VISEGPRWDVPRLAATDRLVEVEPRMLRDARNGSAPRLSTAIRVGLRDGAFLVRFDGRDDGCVATLKKRDDPLWKEDVFEVFLSPDDPPLAYYEFEVNPLGAILDARVDSPEGRRATMRVDVSWDCPGFSARVRRRERRWSALLRIPLAPMGQQERVWRANFYRVDRGENDEYSAWSPTMAEPADFHVPAKFGYLVLPMSS
jgi:hypothetical protein